ncbi:EAL domain-containing protein [Paraburkholderia sp. BCC1885]|uniref:EAL domain-containing protein n=1 Tax=Paraburkholderia sp. BCC1885 TaxID=2562669 RepID=UPI001642E9D3|nr:EAL domain-containing protein [Paraburkholderia sp. BCC1885]
MNDHLYPSPQLTELLSRLGVRSSSQSAPADALCIVASICNLTQIEHVHGATVAATLRQIVHERARQICASEPGIVSMSGEHILFVFDIQSWPELWDGLRAPRVTVLLERILSSLGERPIETPDGPILAVISAAVAPWTEEPFDIAAVGSKAMAHQPGSLEWRDGYVADMNVAAALFNALDEDRLGFEWEPVRDAGSTGLTRYYEALLCEADGGVVTRVGSLVPALERVGLVRRLDQWVVESVIDTLRLNRNVCLGCNVSAQSARLDAWWAFIATALSEEPDIASRLIIEITETAPFHDIAAARDFVESLQSLGCRVALDDVGAGHSSLRALIDLGVDIAKIDHAYVRQTSEDAVAAERLRQLIGLAKTCAADVVVEGIESDEDAEISRKSGATWLQGYLFSRAGTASVKPSVGRIRDQR